MQISKIFLTLNDFIIDESPTHIALREAFINALVHSDYSLSGNIIINIDTEKFVFSNPGTLLVSIQQYFAGGISECRNPSLQQMFMMIGRAEKAGSGVDKIMSGWKNSHWRRPFLQLESQPDRVILTLPMFSVIPDYILEELNAMFDDVNQLTPDELTVLSFCRIEGSISNHRLQYALNMHSTDITNLLKKLCDDEYLISDNNGRWTIYKLNEKVDTYKHKVDTLKEYPDNLPFINTKVDTSKNKVDTSKNKVDTSIQNHKARLSKDELENLIMQVCKDDYLKMETVATRITKSVDYLKNKIFPDMIKSGKLVKSFPYTHNHPEQAYKTSDEYAKKI